jgi:hypothetical protein
MPRRQNFSKFKAILKALVEEDKTGGRSETEE